MDYGMQQTSPALGKNQPKTSDCSFQEPAIALHQRYYTRQEQSSLEPPKTSGWESIHISKFPKALFQNTALAVTGLTETQNPTILLKFILVTYTS